MTVCWGITSGAAGMEAQVQALAVALGLEPAMKRTMLKKPYALLSNALHPLLTASGIFRHIITTDSAPLAPPWPELVISCGRRGALVALGLKRMMQPSKPFFIHIQDPHISALCFDVVVVMQHDKMTGPNVIKTRFALHSITPARLEAARQHWAGAFAAYPPPRIGVLIGGSTNKYTLTESAMRQAIAQLTAFQAQTGASLLITPSRRTGDANIALLRQAFQGNPRVYIYDSTGENPYLGMLALADAVIVTNDSVNMMTDAYATGKPLYLLALGGHADTKPARFAKALLKDNIARPLGDKLEQWAYPVVNEMAEVAEKIRQQLFYHFGTS